MERQSLRVGQAITPEQFEELTDAQLERLAPKAYREYFPGKDFCAIGDIANTGTLRTGFCYIEYGAGRARWFGL